jgi:hypothetical protein
LRGKQPGAFAHQVRVFAISFPAVEAFGDNQTWRALVSRFLAVALALLVCCPLESAGGTLPDQLSDAAYWQLILTLSEPDGSFQSENLLSNETDFPRIMARLKQSVVPGGAYLGVGPEQNFNYIAALRPKVAFIIDIRRQNMLEHLMYKAIFEMSPDRASFVSRLFSRKQPDGLTPLLTAAELFDVYNELPADRLLFEKNLKEMEKLLLQTHRLPLTRDDWRHLTNVYAAFRDFGPLIDYNSRGGGPSGRAFSPSYARLMTETDAEGREWSYLANEENYQSIRDLHMRNLIVPLTGDFGGSKAIRAVGQYLRDHDAVVSAFYLSNVEGYLFQGGDRRGNPNGGAARFYDNASTLPLDKSSTFIRWIPGRQDFDTSISFTPILATIEDFNEGRFTGANLLRSRGFGRAPGSLGGLNRNPRIDFQDPPTARNEFMRRFFPLLLSPMAFFMRWFMWRWREAGEPWPRRLAYSSAWGVGVYVVTRTMFSFLTSTV